MTFEQKIVLWSFIIGWIFIAIYWIRDKLTGKKRAKKIAREIIEENEGQEGRDP